MLQARIVGDLLKVEKGIKCVRSRIEFLNARLNLLRNRADYAAVGVYLRSTRLAAAGISTSGVQGLSGRAVRTLLRQSDRADRCGGVCRCDAVCRAAIPGPAGPGRVGGLAFGSAFAGFRLALSALPPCVRRVRGLVLSWPAACGLAAGSGTWEAPAVPPKYSKQCECLYQRCPPGTNLAKAGGAKSCGLKRNATAAWLLDRKSVRLVGCRKEVWRAGSLCCELVLTSTPRRKGGIAV